MKRIGAFSLVIFIFVLSVFSVIPVYADGDKTVLPCNLKQTMAFLLVMLKLMLQLIRIFILKTATFFLLTLLQLLIIGIYAKMAK